ncbi:MAG: MOSC domain-containing protein [Solirubrobacterales bacterium]|nr:MOSC domain-containing protein [Solirubrobacterales bacterium]
MPDPHRPLAELEAQLPAVRAAPADLGEVRLIVRRPAENERKLLNEAELDPERGLVGDDWISRGSSSTGGGPNPKAQVTVMSARVAAVVSGGEDGEGGERWAPAGDQLYVDLDLSEANLPPWSRLRIGDAVLEVTDEPHLGCGKFSRRFGVDALKFVNSEQGRALRLRGLNARVVEPGTARVGDRVAKLPPH